MKSFFIILIFGVACFFSSCLSQVDEKELEKFPVIIDSSNVSAKINDWSKYQLDKFSTSKYQIFYIGKKTDTIILDAFLNVSGFPRSEDSNGFYDRPEVQRKLAIYKKYYLEWGVNSDFKNWKECKLKIEFDTAQIIENSIPVLLSSLEFDTVEIGYGYFLPLIIEAKDSLGKWQSIQEPFISGCSNGIGNFILPPNEQFLTYVPILNGEYSTELRFKLGKNYSASFHGFIQYSWFTNLE